MWRYKGRKITCWYLYVQAILKAETYAGKAYGKGYFLQLKCVCLVTTTPKNRARLIRSGLRAKFTTVPVKLKVNNCWNFERWLEITGMSMLVKQTSFVLLWSVIFCVRKAVVAWCVRWHIYTYCYSTQSKSLTLTVSKKHGFEHSFIFNWRANPPGWIAFGTKASTFLKSIIL